MNKIPIKIVQIKCGDEIRASFLVNLKYMLENPLVSGRVEEIKIAYRKTVFNIKRLIKENKDKKLTLETKSKIKNELFIFNDKNKYFKITNYKTALLRDAGIKVY